MKKARTKTKIELYVIDKVRDKRMSLSLTQADLAEKLDMSPGFIGQVESLNYPTHYNLNHLNSLARIFKCSISDFFPNKPL